jgi:hypothetical protein
VVPRLFLSVLSDEVCPYSGLKCLPSFSDTRTHTDAILKAVSEIDPGIPITASRRFPPPRERPAMVSQVAIENRNVAEGYILSLTDATLEPSDFKLLLCRHCPSTSQVDPTRH